MPLTLTVNTNTYVTQAEASAFLAERLGTTAWDNAVSGDRDKALVMACRMLEKHRNRYAGLAGSLTQALSWPRTGYDSANRYFDLTAVPDAVKRAQCEQALYLLQTASAANPEREQARAQGVKRVKAGDYEEEYFAATDSGETPALCTEARRLLSPYIIHAPNQIWGLS